MNQSTLRALHVDETTESIKLTGKTSYSGHRGFGYFKERVLCRNQTKDQDIGIIYFQTIKPVEMKEKRTLLKPVANRK